MPGTGAISEKERWVVKIEVEGGRDLADSDQLARDLDKLVAKFNKRNRKASWTGKTRKKN